MRTRRKLVNEEAFTADMSYNQPSPPLKTKAKRLASSSLYIEEPNPNDQTVCIDSQSSSSYDINSNSTICSMSSMKSTSINNEKSINISPFLDDSRTLPIPQGSVPSTQNILKPSVSPKEPLDFRQFLSETQLQKLNQQETQKANQQIISITQKNNNNALTKSLISTNENLSSASKNLINSILSKPIKSTIATPASVPATSSVKSDLESIASSILQKPSIKQKYEKLLESSSDVNSSTATAGPRKLLPQKYEEILSNFIKLDECIKFFKGREKRTLFNELKSNMERSMKASITIKQIKQIMFIYPQAFQVKWVKSSLDSLRQELSVDILQEQSTSTAGPQQESRESIFESLLRNKVNEFHNLFIDSRQLSDKSQWMNAQVGVQQQQYHPNFDLESLPELEEAVLPEMLRSQSSRIEDSSDTLMKLMASKQQGIAEKEAEKQKLIEKSKSILTTENKSGLSDRLYQLIKAKEEKLKEEKNSGVNIVAGSEADMQRRIPEIKKVVEITVVYFIQRKVSNMFHVNLIDHIVSQPNVVMSKAEVASIFEFLVAKCPFWITSIPNKSGAIIRIDKAVSISKVLATFDK